LAGKTLVDSYLKQLKIWWIYTWLATALKHEIVKGVIPLIKVFADKTMAD